MLLFPLKTKFKKYHKRNRNLFRKEVKYVRPLAGFAALKALTTFRATAVQVEAVRKSIVKSLKKRFYARLRICFFPDLPVTKKSAGVRMGKGKGDVDFWCFLVKKGRILFELNKQVIPASIIYTSFFVSMNKLGGRCRVIV